MARRKKKPRRKPKHASYDVTHIFLGKASPAQKERVRRKKRRSPYRGLRQITRQLKTRTAKVFYPGNITVGSTGTPPGEAFAALPGEIRKKVLDKATHFLGRVSTPGVKSVVFDELGNPYIILARARPIVRMDMAPKSDGPGEKPKYTFYLRVPSGFDGLVSQEAKNGPQLLDPEIFIEKKERGWSAARHMWSSAQRFEDLVKVVATSFEDAIKQITSTSGYVGEQIKKANRRLQSIRSAWNDLKRKYGEVEISKKKVDELRHAVAGKHAGDKKKIAELHAEDRILRRKTDEFNLLAKRYAEATKALLRSKEYKIWWAVEVARRQPDLIRKAKGKDADVIKSVGVRRLSTTALGPRKINAEPAVDPIIVRSLGLTNPKKVFSLLGAEKFAHSIWFPMTGLTKSEQEEIFHGELEPHRIHQLLSSGRPVGAIRAAGKSGGSLHVRTLRGSRDDPEHRIIEVKAAEPYHVVFVPLRYYLTFFDSPPVGFRKGFGFMHTPSGPSLVVPSSRAGKLGWKAKKLLK